MPPPEPRFLTLNDVAEILSTSVVQVRALIRDQQLRAIQIGGRKQYRVETSELEAYIQGRYAEAYGEAGETDRSAATAAKGTSSGDEDTSA